MHKRIFTKILQQYTITHTCKAGDLLVPAIPPRKKKQFENFHTTYEMCNIYEV